MVYWGLVWCIGGWCGVLEASVVYWGPVLCIGGGMMNLGLGYTGNCRVLPTTAA